MMTTATPKQGVSRWYPTKDQLKDPAATERSFRQALTQLYELTDRVGRIEVAGGDAAAASKSSPASSPPPGSGPTDSMLLGLHVAPVDTATLANGATLKFNKAAGNFYFG
jgi:hypothetical protein